jgi:Family of unknown function (DUF6056)
LPGLCEWAIGAALSAVLLAYVLLGNFTRYVADDYATADAVRLRGYWAQQIAAYRLSDGHFVATALYTAGTLLNPIFVRFLPGALIIAWVALLSFALRHVFPAAGRLGHFLIAAGIVYGTLQITASPFLSLYWMTASLEFVVPLLIASVLIRLMSSPSSGGRRRWLIVALIGLLAFLAAGEAEIYTTVQCVALVLAVAVAAARLSSSWRRKLPELSAGLVGSLAGLTGELASPGKALRSAAIANAVHVPRPSWLTLPLFTLGQLVHFLQLLIRAHWWEFVAVLLLAFLIGARSTIPTTVDGKFRVISVVVASFCAFAILLASMAPAALYYGNLPPFWDQIVPVYVCVCAVAALGWWSGQSFRAVVGPSWQRAGWAEPLRKVSISGVSIVLSAAVVIGPITTLIAVKHELPAIESYAAIKDAQAAGAAAAHAAGRTSATVPRVVMLNNMGIFSHPSFEELTADPDYWINKDEATYYGIASVRTSP